MSTLEALEYGKDHERLAISDLSNALGIKIKPSGLMIDFEFSFLGATPDGIIDADLSSLKIPTDKIMNGKVLPTMEDSETGGIVEVKCPIAASNVKTLKELLKVSSVLEMLSQNNPHALNKTHRYYYQVQGALRHTKRHFCVFLIWAENVNHFFVIERDDEFWKTKMEMKLIRFYNECLLLEIVDSRKDRSRPIRESKYCLNAQEEKKKNNLLKENDQRNVQITSDKFTLDKKSVELKNDEFMTESDDSSSDNESVDSEEFDDMFDEMWEKME